MVPALVSNIPAPGCDGNSVSACYASPACSTHTGAALTGTAVWGSGDVGIRVHCSELSPKISLPAKCSILRIGKVSVCLRRAPMHLRSQAQMSSSNSRPACQLSPHSSRFSAIVSCMLLMPALVLAAVPRVAAPPGCRNSLQQSCSQLTGGRVTMECRMQSRFRHDSTARCHNCD